jgi:hypothetical protein
MVTHLARAKIPSKRKPSISERTRSSTPQAGPQRLASAHRRFRSTRRRPKVTLPGPAASPAPVLGCEPYPTGLSRGARHDRSRCVQGQNGGTPSSCQYVPQTTEPAAPRSASAIRRVLPTPACRRPAPARRDSHTRRAHCSPVFEANADPELPIGESSCTPQPESLAPRRPNARVNSLRTVQMLPTCRVGAVAVRGIVLQDRRALDDCLNVRQSPMVIIRRPRAVLFRSRPQVQSLLLEVA